MAISVYVNVIKSLTAFLQRATRATTSLSLKHLNVHGTDKGLLFCSPNLLVSYFVIFCVMLLVWWYQKPIRKFSVNFWLLRLFKRIYCTAVFLMTACKNLKALQWATIDGYSIKIWMVNDIICSMEINTTLLSNECDAWQNNWLIPTMESSARFNYRTLI